MPERELLITLRLARAAAVDREMGQLHANEQRRIRQTGKVFADDFKTRAALSKQFFKQEAEAQNKAAKAANALFKDVADKKKKAAKDAADAQKKAIKDVADAEKKAAKDANALFQTRKALTKQFFKEQADAANKAAKDEAERKKQYIEISEQVSKKLNQIAIEDYKEKKKLEERSAKEAIAIAHQEIGAENKARKEGRLKALKEAVEATRRRVEETEKIARDAEASGQAAIESDRKVRQIRRQADEADATRKFVSNEGFKQDRARKEAEKTGGVQRSEAKKTTNALEEQQERILNVSRAYTIMRIGAEVSQAIHYAVESVNESLRNSRDHIGEMVRNTEQLRDAMRELLNLQGKPMSSGATSEELAGFAALGLNPQQGIAAGKAFRENAQGMIQPEKLGPGMKATSYRMTPEQAKELSGFAAKVAASQGMDVAPAEELMSTLISKADTDAATGKVDTEKVKAQFARNMGLFRNERGSTALDVRQAAEAIQKNAATAADIDRLAVMHAAQAEIQPGKTRVHLDALVRGLDQLKDEQREQLGIKPGMTDEQKLSAATAAIPRIARAEFGGEERRAARQFFNDQRELDAFMAHLNRGVRGGVYERVRGEQAAGSVAGAEAAHREFLGGEAGTAGRQQSERAREEALRAAHYRNLTEARRQAAIGLIGGQYGEMPEGLMDAIKTRAGTRFGMSGNAFEDETERSALREVTNGLRATAEGRAFLEQNNGIIRPTDPEPVKAQAYNLWRRLQRQKAPTTPVGGDERRHPFNPRLQGAPYFGGAGDPDGSRDPAKDMAHEIVQGIKGNRRHNVVLPYASSMRSLMESEAGGRRRGRRISLPGADGRLAVLPGADGRVSRRFRHGYVGDAPNSVVGPVRRRAHGPADVGAMGRLGGGAMGYGGGMFAADPAHAAAQAHIAQNHQFIDQYRQREGDTAIDMAARSSAMGQRRNEIAAALKSAMGLVTPPVPPSMPSKPFVFRN